MADLQFYVKSMVQAEMCTEDQIFDVNLAEIQDTFLKRIQDHFEEKARTSTGEKVGVVTVANVGSDRMGILLNDTKRFPGHQPDEEDGTFPAVMVYTKVGIAFNTDNYDKVAELMSTMSQNPDLMSYHGLAWKWFDPSES